MNKGTLEPKLEILIYMQVQYLSATSKVNLSLATLKYCSNVIYESGHKLGSLRWEKGTLLICYRINKYSNPLWKIDKLTFTKIWLVLEATLKSKQSFTLSYILSPPATPSHTMSYLAWLVLETTLKSKQPFILPYILSPPLQPRHIPRLIWLG